MYLTTGQGLGTNADSALNANGVPPIRIQVKMASLKLNEDFKFWQEHAQFD
jgi:hypothetical protein